MTEGPGRAWALARRTPSRTPRWVVWSVLALALVLLLVGSLTLWVRQQALDTDRWVDTSSRLLADDDVRGLAAAELVDALFTGPDLEGRIRRLLPSEAAALAAPAVGLLRQAALPAAEDLLGRPATQRLWAEANRAAHRRLVAVLDDDADGVLTATGGTVVLDLRPLVERLGARLGVTPRLRPGAGRITVLHSGGLGAAQDAVAALRRVSSLVAIGFVVLVPLALFLAEGYRRTVLAALAAGLLGIGAALLVARRLVGDALVDRLTSPPNHDVGRAVWAIGTDVLRDIALGLLVYGAVLLAGTWLAGPARRAVTARRRLVPAARDHLPWTYGVVAAAVLALLAWGPSSGSRRLLGTLVLIALVVAGVEVLRRQILREAGSPHATAPGSPT